MNDPFNTIILLEEELNVSGVVSARKLLRQLEKLLIKYGQKVELQFDAGANNITVWAKPSKKVWKSTT